MMKLEFKVDLAPIAEYEKRLGLEMRIAIDDGVLLLRDIFHEQVVALDAWDTGGMYESAYISVWGYSDYEEAVSGAAEAYANNSTMWPEIRAIFGGHLELDEEIHAEGPWEGYLGIAAAHAKFVEVGYISFYGNDVPARPVIATTASIGYPDVVAEFEKAIIRAAG